MSKSHAPQLYFRRAYVDDPKTFSRYVPIAEQILCLAEQTDALTDVRLRILKQCATGTTGSNIAKIEFSTFKEGVGIALVSRNHRESLKLLSPFDDHLVSSYIRIRRHMPQSLRLSWQHENMEKYRSKPEAVRLNKISRSEYYDTHRKKINRRRRKRWNEQSSDPKILKKRRKYLSRPDVLARARERMRIRSITHRKRVIAKCKRNHGKPGYRAWRKSFRLSERYKELVKVRQNIYRECAALLKQLNDPDNPWKRHDAALALGIRARDYRGASAALIRTLSDPHWNVREAIVWTLGERREWKAARRLIRMAKDADVSRDNKMLVNILTALWKIGTPETLAIVKRYTDHPNAVVKDEAAKLIRLPPFFILRDKKSNV